MKTLVVRARELRKSGTDHEDLIWKKLRNRSFLGLKFKRQQPIDGYIVDFCCFEKRLVIEVDGSIHEEPNQRAYDEERDSHLRYQGFRVIRFTNDEIERDMQQVLKEIETFIHGPSHISGEGHGGK